MIIRLSLFILGCISGCKSCNNLIINLICGAGGTNNEQGGRDDKDKDNQRSEPFYKPSKRRR